MTPYEKTCGTCGAVHEVTEKKVTFRDMDTFECPVCGETVADWNGSRIISSKLVKRPDGSVSR